MLVNNTIIILQKYKFTRGKSISLDDRCSALPSYWNPLESSEKYHRPSPVRDVWSCS